MAHAEVNGKRYELLEDWRISEQIEAENALGYGLEDAKTAAKMALLLYMSIRRVTPADQMPAGPLADMVNNMSITEAVGDEDEEGDAVPPAPEPGEGETGEEDTAGNGDSGTAAQRITGRRPSDSLA